MCILIDLDGRVSIMMIFSCVMRGVVGGGLLYVLNCVRMKEDKKMWRGVMVKVMVICILNFYIGIYKVRFFFCGLLKSL